MLLNVGATLLGQRPTRTRHPASGAARARTTGAVPAGDPSNRIKRSSSGPPDTCPRIRPPGTAVSVATTNPGIAVRAMSKARLGHRVTLDTGDPVGVELVECLVLEQRAREGLELVAMGG